MESESTSNPSSSLPNSTGAPAIEHPDKPPFRSERELEGDPVVEGAMNATGTTDGLTQSAVTLDTDSEGLDLPSPSTNSSHASTFQDDSMEVDNDEEQDEDEEDDDDDEKGDESDGDTSELSQSGSLVEDLQESLEGDFGFKGSFSYASSFPDAPNPILTINGIGHVGLPLSERDAKAIIACSAQAPFGKGEDTVVDKKVRDTWEIDPSNISFRNPAWGPWIQTLARVTVWQALGVAPPSTQPRCELYKLLLYEPGSHFLPHQDTQKADGMFATVVVLLPSPYTGGQVHVSHSSRTNVIDLALSSMLSTSVLAWYTDVVHEVKPVTSGYRLALSYNLIHTSPNIPRPTLPNMHTAVNALRHVLRKWKKELYSNIPQPPLIAYLLEHQYSGFNLGNGVSTLKGADAHKVAHLMPVAQTLGFKVCLAKLDYNISGTADDDYGYSKRHRYDCFDDDEDEDEDDGTPSMLEVNDKDLKLSNLVDVQGHHPLGSTKFSIQEDCLIPMDPFEDENPDNTEYEGYMGNGAGQLDYWYHRTVLVIYHESREFDIMFHHGGAAYGLSKLRTSTGCLPPSDEDKGIAAAVLRVMMATDKATAVALLDFAMKWADIDMWKQVVIKCGYALGAFGVQQLASALNPFPFEALRESYEEFLKRSVKLQERLGLVDEIRKQAKGGGPLKAWCEGRSSAALASYNSALLEDIPTLIAIAQERGLACITDIVLPNLMKKPLAYEFWVAFAKALYPTRRVFAQQSTGGASEPAAATDGAGNNQPVDKLIEKALDAAAAQWEGVTAKPSYYATNHSTADNMKVNRIVEIVVLCLSTQCMAPCYKLFVNVLKAKGDMASNIARIYSPLIPKLQKVLKSKKVDICSRPFGDLMQAFVVSCLGDILGSKPKTGRVKLRKIGCGCHHCTILDEFILGPTKEHTFRETQRTRTHIESRLITAQDLCTYNTVRRGTPHSLIVTKLPEVVAAATWNDRHQKARLFLGLVGDDATLARLMGDRYADVVKALDGSQPFPKTSVHRITDRGGPAKTQPAPAAAQASTSREETSSSSTAAAGVLPAAVSTNPTARTTNPIANPASMPANTVAGTKRKKAPLVQLGPVIDLTAEDSS